MAFCAEILQVFALFRHGKRLAMIKVGNDFLHDWHAAADGPGAASARGAAAAVADVAVAAACAKTGPTVRARSARVKATKADASNTEFPVRRRIWSVAFPRGVGIAERATPRKGSSKGATGPLKRSVALCSSSPKGASR